MKSKILFAATFFICFELNAQNTNSQQSLIKNAEQQFTQSLANENHFPGANVCYDSVQRKLVFPDQNHQKNINTTSTEKISSNTFHLTKDINSVTDAAPYNYNFSAYQTQQYAVLNNTIYYTADDGIHGRELWKSDGTTSGTKLVKDINTGEAGSEISDITVVNGKLCFFAYTPDYGREIWVSDGTSNGTKILKDMVAGTASGYPFCTCNVNGTLFFLNNSGANNQLWKTDGTKAGTVMVIDLTASLNCTQALQFVAAGNLLFFTGQTYPYFNNRELYRSDGTAAGTYMVKDINPNAYGNGPIHLTAYNNKLYFCENDGTNQYLWMSDGTAAGTTYAPGYNNVLINGGYDIYPSPFIVAGGAMYFPAYNSTYGNELFKYNAGDGLGVVLVKDINAVFGSTYFTTNVMAAVGNTVYFGFTDASGLSQLWKTTGTDASTIKVADLANVTAYYDFYSGNGMVYFEAYTAATGYELWRSDGTPANTGIVKDIYDGGVSSNPYCYTACNNKVFFGAKNLKGSELWQTDGTAANTFLLKDINTTTTSSSSPSYITAFKNNSVIYDAYTPDKGNELYTSDGSETGTKLVKEIIPGETGSGPQQYKIKNNYAYFIGYDANSNYGIFKTDATAANTTELSYWNYYSYSFNDYTVADNGLVFYILQNRSTGLIELWRTDGTVGGTYVLKSNFSNYIFRSLTAMGNNAYFSANDATASYGAELWKSNGTVAGTKIVKDIVTGSGSSTPQNLYAFNSVLYFSAYDGTNNNLWESDGTASGTKKLKDVTPVVFQASDSIVYFNGYTAAYGNELWRTDGTAGGTTLVKDIKPGTNGSNVYNLIDVNGVLFFTADDGINGNELWKSKGTTPTTKLVKDITTGSGSTNFINYNGFGTVAAAKLFFSYADYSIGKNYLWVSDGTSNGTNAVADAGLDNVYINEIEGSGNLLYINGSNFAVGAELYVGDASVINGLQKTNTITKAVAVNNLSAQLVANPFSSQLNINISSKEVQKVNVVVSNAAGNIYYNRNIDLQSANATCKINTAAWINGVYLIKIVDIQGKSNVVTLRAIK